MGEPTTVSSGCFCTKFVPGRRVWVYPSYLVFRYENTVLGPFTVGLTLVSQLSVVVVLLCLKS